MLNNRDGTLFTSAIKYRYNDDSRIFTEKDGFQMALAVIDQRTFPTYHDELNRELEDYTELKLFNFKRD